MVGSTPPDNDNTELTGPIPEQQDATDSAGAEEPGSQGASWTQHLDLIKHLAELVEAENLSEVEVEGDGLRISLKTPVALAATNNVQFVAPLTNTLPAEAIGLPATETATTPGQPVPGVTSKAAKADKNLVPIVSPMVGVFYRASSPDNPPLVEIGDYIEVGQEVALVEAMKVFNEITSEIEGTVVEIRAQNAQLVETGSVLIMIRKP